jgi:hypothetical protein
MLDRANVLVGDGASDPTLRRMLGEIDDRARIRIAKASAGVRARVRDLLAERDTGFRWLVILGRPGRTRAPGDFILSPRGARIHSSAWP